MIFPLINGNYFAFADIELRANGLQFAGVKAINYKDNLNRAKVRGTASVPLGMTKGHYEASGDIELYLDAFNTLITAFPGIWRQTPFAISVTYGPNIGQNLPLVTDILPGVYLGEVDASQSESEDPLSRKVTLLLTGQILWNSLPSFVEVGALTAIA